MLITLRCFSYQCGRPRSSVLLSVEVGQQRHPQPDLLRTVSQVCKSKKAPLFPVNCPSGTFRPVLKRSYSRWRCCSTFTVKETAAKPAADKTRRRLRRRLQDVKLSGLKPHLADKKEILDLSSCQQ